MRILINVVNARNVGGGLQVVQNFLLGTQKYMRSDVEWYYAVSECLDQNYIYEAFKTKAIGHYFVFPNQPDFRHTYRRVQKRLRQLEKEISPDVIYTILGPGYNFFKNKEVIRFANAWSTNPNQYAWKTLSLKGKLRTALYGILERTLLRKAEYIITQTETVKQGLIRVTKLPNNNIAVVPNVLPAIYQDLPKTHNKLGDNIDIAAIGGAMPHKNFDIIPQVLHLLCSRYNITNIRFHMTLPVESTVWQRIKEQLDAYLLNEMVVNHGKLTLYELSDLYNKCNFAFLPSVLETFSASTIEAMHFSLPIVASNLSFNTEVLTDSALYYEPMNAADAADKIATLIKDKNLQDSCSARMSKRIVRYIDFKKYYNDTVDFLVEVGNGKFDVL
jgi:glycosyltransferase involved in cell wall biosynthesis